MVQYVDTTPTTTASVTAYLQKPQHQAASRGQGGGEGAPRPSSQHPSSAPAMKGVMGVGYGRRLWTCGRQVCPLVGEAMVSTISPRPSTPGRASEQRVTPWPCDMMNHCLVHYYHSPFMSFLSASKLCAIPFSLTLFTRLLPCDSLHARAHALLEPVNSRQRDVMRNLCSKL